MLTALKCAPSGRPLGMESGDISNADITTSSCATTSPCGHEARLNAMTSWMAALNDQTEPYIQIHLRAYHMITAIVTQGGTDKWVTSFKISYGVEETDLTIYTDVDEGTEMVFPGNYDNTTSVTTSLTPYILAKYISIRPKSSNSTVSMRLELIGYGPLPDHVDDIHKRDGTCLDKGIPLGVENGDIGDESLTAHTSEPSDPSHTARLNSVTGGGWIPLNTDSTPFLQVSTLFYRCDVV
ncbi:EGF-like repeat and discoidin I-like domain-containing protein 3 [Strongylocentrotus purpuratus]|uniref:F5/8 type C domain-containing protein n=1 Tax=Strongylocentrotus purpuratus TaxID=7668 RepID=A0A7M7NRC9_STRPU|nr:EGF-like repeat and discoidin I-like domain-containing protein 3 [Strongylocentrotus purpuratus]